MAYETPPASALKTRYPAFAAVLDATVDYWIADAKRFVTTAWTEPDYAPALMALAAHNMALAGMGADAATSLSLPAGVSRIKSASFEASFTDESVNARAAGTYAATRYGQEYLTLLRRNRGGPRTSPSGTLPYSPYLRYPQGVA